MSQDTPKQYITTTLPYVNSKPHVGFCMEIIRADAMNRYWKLMGYDVFFNTGTDEHGQKLYEGALAENKTPQEYVDFYAEKFRELTDVLGIDPAVHFIRTTDADHMVGAQALWNRVYENGYIYRDIYKAKYCVGCELEKTDSELVDGQCPIHPTYTLQEISEENYFFRFSAFEKPLLELYAQRPDFVVPDFRMNEVSAFVAGGLHDFSISRQKSKMPWGTPVPGDDSQVMYVWFDALSNYINTLGWHRGSTDFDAYWVNGRPIQYAGQDNVRQQSAIWQAMLMAAGMPTSHQIHINGFIMGSDGRKMSKSIGNVVDPIPLVEHYGAESLRYFLLHYIHPYDGSPMGYEVFHTRYTADLVNGIGNLTSRLMTLAEKYLPEPVVIPEQTLPQDWIDAFQGFRMDTACDIVMQWVADLDGDITKTEPFKLAKTDLPSAQQLLREYLVRLYTIGRMLNPIMPSTSAKIKDLVRQNKKPTEPLFPRLDPVTM